MKWIPTALVGAMTALAAIAAYMSDPLFDNWQDEPVFVPVIGLGWIAAIFYGPFFVAAIGGTIAAFRALWLSTRRGDLAAELALGRTRGSLIAAEVRTGARDGLIAGGVGVALGGLLRQLRTGFTDVEFVSNSLWNYLAWVILAVTSFAIAYWVAAAWATRGTVRQMAQAAPAAQRQDRPADAQAGSRRRRRLLIGAGIVAGVIGICVGLIAAGTETVAAVVASVVLTVVLGIAVPAGLAYGGARASAGLSRVVARAAARGAAPGTGRSLAADALTRPTPMRTGALAAIVVVMGVAGLGTAVYASNQARPDVAAATAPEASVASVQLRTPEGTVEGPSGWAPAIDPDTAEALRSDPDLLVVDAGVLVTDRRELPDHYQDPGYVVQDRDLLLAVDADALAPVAEDAARTLYLTGGVEWTYGLLGTTGIFADGAPYVEVDGVREDIAQVGGVVPWAGVERDWAEAVWGEAPTAALLLYPAGDVSVEEALNRHDLSGLALERVDSNPFWSSPLQAAPIVGLTAPFLLVAVGIVIAMAAASQRLRARDQATLLALGATRAALRRAAMIEAALPTLVAGLGGALVGGALGAVLAEVSVAPLGVAPWSWVAANVGWTLGLVPWGVLVALAAGGALLAAAGATLIRVRLDRLTPAEQLTDAQKAGIS